MQATQPSATTMIGTDQMTVIATNTGMATTDTTIMAMATTITR